jgi:hypothetical protein
LGWFVVRGSRSLIHSEFPQSIPNAISPSSLRFALH